MSPKITVSREKEGGPSIEIDNLSEEDLGKIGEMLIHPTAKLDETHPSKRKAIEVFSALLKASNRNYPTSLPPTPKLR